MKSSKPVFLLVALVCAGLLAFAMYLQIVEEMQPCPLCVIQRYMFVLVGVFALIGASLPAGARRGSAALGLLAALGGAGTAIWHLYVKAHPGVSCTTDPLETALNQLPTAKLLPQMFTADGFCSAPWPPVFGLQIPTWSLIWFAVLAVMLAVQAFKRAPRTTIWK
ncbi:disulfide bond formation protein B [Herbaspirillum sp. AP02]|uniref:disulfide bond formation protein B n=1 Tax=unclassified Herbaspirillum TaxID=2624150 RepID=UPI0015DBC592|nr:MULTISPECIES: disulfide bond formation protein B [unclassified Herbaspirillum]MBG7620854.1 disulfide bond formation protein B [Herbaspirillum sp. AP02]NZD68317.1 disulfide bond formation protein B [Herbaspirillum sp. AP21]